MRSHSYRKRMNLSCDKAIWYCHEVHLRSTKKSVGVLYARRKCLSLSLFVDFLATSHLFALADIPPNADYYQDFAFVLQQPRQVVDSAVKQSRKEVIGE